MRTAILEEPVSQAAVWSRRLAIFALAVGAVAFAIIRTQSIDMTSGLAVFGSAILLACAALLCAGAAGVVIWRTGRRGLGAMLTGIVLSCLFLAYPAFLAFQAMRLPVLNDVTTDLVDPPQFSLAPKALDARGGRTPPTPPSATRQAQRAAYPEVQAILLELDADEAYQLVLQAVQACGWRIIHQSAPGGRLGLGHIDAVDRTLVMGFTDDVTVRVKPLAGQTKIDVRSASRYGRNDFGANARRIEIFAQAVQDQLNARRAYSEKVADFFDQNMR